MAASEVNELLQDEIAVALIEEATLITSGSGKSPQITGFLYSIILHALFLFNGVSARQKYHFRRLYGIAVRDNFQLFIESDIIDDMTEVAAYEKTPLLYRIKNDRRLNYCKELIATVMQANGLEKLENYENRQWGKEYPYEKIEPLIERNRAPEPL